MNCSVQLSYEKGTTPGIAWMKTEAKRHGVTYRPTYSCYVGHIGLKASGTKAALKKFLSLVWLEWGITFITKEV
jgi:hypothetical protein